MRFNIPLICFCYISDSAFTVVRAGGSRTDGIGDSTDIELDATIKPTRKEGVSRCSRQTVTPANNRRLEANRKSVRLQNTDTDFLLYQATAAGGFAVRRLMIQCLIDGLERLGPGDSILQACESANEAIESQLKLLNLASVTGQVPKIESTLTKKFCIGKFRPTRKSILARAGNCLIM